MKDHVGGPGSAPNPLMGKLLASLSFGIALSAPIVSVGAQSLPGLGPDPATHQTGAVAKKVASFDESFHDGVVGGMDFSPDGAQLAVNAMLAGPNVHVWNWRPPSHIARVLDLDSGTGDGKVIVYSPNGTLLAVGHGRESAQRGFRVIHIWDPATGNLAHSISDPQGGDGSRGLAFLPDGRFLIRLVPGGANDYLVLHDTDTWNEVWSLHTAPFIPLVLALSPDGSFAALGGYAFLKGEGAVIDPEILVVDLKARQLLRTMTGAFPLQSEIHALDWSADGKALAAGVIVGGSYPGPDAVKVFDPMTGLELSREPAKLAYVNGLRFSRNGRYLAEGCIDGQVRIWDGRHTSLLQTISVSTHSHTTVAFSRDSRYLAIGDVKNVSIWALQ